MGVCIEAKCVEKEGTQPSEDVAESDEELSRVPSGLDVLREKIQQWYTGNQVHKQVVGRPPGCCMACRRLSRMGMKRTEVQDSGLRWVTSPQILGNIILMISGETRGPHRWQGVAAMKYYT